MWVRFFWFFFYVLTFSHSHLLFLSCALLKNFLFSLAFWLQPSLTKLQLHPHIHPSVPLFSLPPLTLSLALLRQTQLPSWTFPFCRPAPTKVLSHVKPNLQPPKTWPLTPSVFTQPEGEGSWGRKGRLLGKGHIPEDTFVCARVCVCVCVFVSVQAPNPLCGLCSRVSMCVWLSVCIQTCMGVNFPLYPSVLNCLLNFHACVLYVTAV